MTFLEIKRYSTTPESTMGLLFQDGVFRCHTLEDTKRPIKKAGVTRIPDGLYRLDLREKSPMADRYRDLYPWHEHGMIWIRDVPEFKWVYMHPGNTAEDTRGCPLLGQRPNNNSRLPGYLYESMGAYKPFYREIATMLSGMVPSVVKLRISNLG